MHYYSPNKPASFFFKTTITIILFLYCSFSILNNNSVSYIAYLVTFGPYVVFVVDVLNRADAH